jgi:hypothetical protein
MLKCILAFDILKTIGTTEENYKINIGYISWHLVYVLAKVELLINFIPF